ncbi:hypothetical protein BGP78_08160 [Pseudoalteromonas sp. MSK9-3]|nr:hypothetical protein BGP78_08160 [Pseudoalteromonas sp. MSK9-3]
MFELSSIYTVAKRTLDYFWFANTHLKINLSTNDSCYKIIMINFLNFQFDVEQGLLSQEQRFVSLNHTQIQLLTLLISEPARVFSKEEILAAVWQHKVVSEQVIFQNISQLRALLGESVIRTFPKKGYQWNIPLEDIGNVHSITEPESASIELTSARPATNKIEVKLSNVTSLSGEHKSASYKKRSYNSFIYAGVILCISFFFIIYNSASSAFNSKHFAYSQFDSVFLPLTLQSNKKLAQETEQLNQLLSSEFNIPSNKLERVNEGQFFNSPYMTYHTLQKDNTALLFSGTLYKNYNEATKPSQPYMFELLIQGYERQWVSYLYAQDMTELSGKVIEQMRILSNSRYFIQQQSANVSAELVLLNGQFPLNLSVLQKLAERFIDEDKFDAADGYIEQLLTLSTERQHALYYAYGKWLKGALFAAKGKQALALALYEQANTLFSDTLLYGLQSEVNKSLADLAHDNRDYDKVKAYLYAAASLARLARKPVQEIQAYTLLSIKAGKFGFEKASYDHLYQAKTLLAEYELDGSHYMLPFYHFALFASTTEEKQHFFHKVLRMPVTPDNEWVFFSAVEALSKLYLRENNFRSAKTVIDQVKKPALKAYLDAQYYQANGDVSLAILSAQDAFNVSRTQHTLWLSLNSALLLLELANTTHNIEVSEYRVFIESNANLSWLQRRQTRLAQVGIAVPAL